MHDLAESFLSKEFVFFCLGIAALTYVFRIIVDFGLSHPRSCATPNNRIWKELILPIFPIIIGGTIAYLAKSYPFPTEFVQHVGRTFFGMVSGMFSGLVYRIIKSLLSIKDQSTGGADKDPTQL